MPKQITVGVLSLQGSVEEHKAILSKIDNVRPIDVKTKATLSEAEGIILPGGESTAIAKLLHSFDLFESLKQRIMHGLPVWGTCAGMILLAKQIVGEEAHLGVMDITVRRNAYGSQLDSFASSALIPEIAATELPLVFIRAPWIEGVGDSVKVLHQFGNHITAARQDNMLATSFHPELTESILMHSYFIKMIRRQRGYEK